ncbi:hypothetical protein [Kosakonia phage Kc283]|uniref:Uncharacterized protein n=1 Tax=Kosakonia phage Kc283 TaxID=2863195 RepID=A0AAE8BE96_9CAUD|nr:hypothetical protein PP755_gp18 [Kosakonia phage Kc283]QYN79820.1 hypothetical protein [Kosakonia phage Kc283]
MELLHKLPSPTVPVGRMNIPLSLVSTTKASLLSGMQVVDVRITPAHRDEEVMRVHLPTLGVTAVAVYQDGEDKLVKLFRE